MRRLGERPTESFAVASVVGRHELTDAVARIDTLRRFSPPTSANAECAVRLLEVGASSPVLHAVAPQVGHFQ
jgi:hypothetical protein